MKKQLPERYAKIWQYLIDDKQTVNKGRISGMIEEIFISRLGDTKDLLKNNIKSMKIRNKFDLRNDGWQKEVIGAWRRLSLPEIIDEVTTLKQIPDIKKRAPKMQQWLGTIGVATSPLHILTVMEDEYVHGADPHDGGDGDDDDVPLPPVDEDDGPGFLRRAASGVGAGAKAVLGAAGAGLLGATMRHGGVLAPIAGAGIAAFGLARSIKKGMTSGGSKISTGPKSMFGSGRKSGTPRAKQTDFTPREEELEGGGIKGVLERIEANTAALLEKFGGKAAAGEKKNDLLSLMGKMVSGLGGFLLKIFSPLTAILTTLGALLPGIVSALNSILGKLGLSLLRAAPAAGAAAAAAARAIANVVKPVGLGVMATIYSPDAGLDSDLVPGMSEKEKDLAMKRATVYHTLKNEVRGPDGQPMSDEQIAGIMGNIQAESGFDPQVESKPDSAGRTAFGIAQWRGVRKAALIDFAESRGIERGQPIDIETQAKFMAKELMDRDKNGAMGTLDSLLKTKTAQEASDVVVDKYERPFTANTSAEYREKETSKRRTMSMTELANIKRLDNYRLKTNSAGEIGVSPAEFEPYVPNVPKKENVSMSAVLADLLNKIDNAPDALSKEQMIEAYEKLSGRRYTKISPAELNDQNYIKDAQFMLKERAGESIEHQQEAQKSLRDIYYPTTPKAPGITPPEIKNDKSSQAPTAPIMVSQNNTNAGGGGGGGRAGHYNKDESFFKSLVDNTVLA